MRQSFILAPFLIFYTSILPGNFLNSFDDKASQNRSDSCALIRYVLHTINPGYFDAPSALKISSEQPETATHDIPSLEDLTKDPLIYEYVHYLQSLDSLTQAHIKLARGLLLYGPPGTGKTTIAKAIAQKTGFDFTEIMGGELANKYLGEESRAIRQLFNQLRKTNKGTILLVDEIDTLGSQGNEELHEESQRSLATFWKEIENNQNKNIHVIGTTNRFNRLHPALIRSGRFHKHIAINLPDENERKRIFAFYLKKLSLSISDNLINFIAQQSEGLSGADLEALANEIKTKILLNDNNDETTAERAFTLFIDKKNSLEKSNKPADVSLSQALTMLSTANNQSPSVPEDDIKLNFRHEEQVSTNFKPFVGDLPKTLEMVLKYLKNPEKFQAAGVNPPRSLLLYGPPGNGKTTIARMIAAEAGIDFISVCGSDFSSKYFGSSGKAVHSLFQYARDLSRPVVLFIDEIDSAAMKRKENLNQEDAKIVNALLTELADEENRKNIFTVGATNKVKALDAAAIRKGRFDHSVEIEAPDQEQRAQIFKYYLQKFSYNLNDSSGSNEAVFKELLEKMNQNGCSGKKKPFSASDIEALVNTAALISCTSDSQFITKKHFDEAYDLITETNKAGWQQSLANFVKRLPVIHEGRKLWSHAHEESEDE